MHVLSVALQVAGLLVEDPAPAPGGVSPVAQIITVTLAGIAAIITAAAGFNGLRKRRQAEADAAGPEIVVPVDPDDRPSRLRERLASLETTAKAHERRISDLEEQNSLHRAVDVAMERDAAIRRRRRAPSD